MNIKKWLALKKFSVVFCVSLLIALLCVIHIFASADTADTSPGDLTMTLEGNLDSLYSGYPSSEYTYISSNEMRAVIHSESGEVITAANIDGRGTRTVLLPGYVDILVFDRETEQQVEYFPLNISVPDATAHLLLTVGEEIKPNSRFDPSDYSDVYSTNEAIATVSRITGTVTGIAPGSCYIYGINPESGTVCALAEVNVYTPFEASDNMELHIPVGSSTALSDHEIDISELSALSSSDTSVAVIDGDGNITALSKGSAVISGTYADTGTSVDILTVNAYTPEIPDVYMLAGYEADLNEITDLSGYSSLSSSDSSLVTIDENGTVTALTEGEPIIFTEDELEGVDWDKYYAHDDMGSGCAGVEYYPYVFIYGEKDGEITPLLRISVRICDDNFLPLRATVGETLPLTFTDEVYIPSNRIWLWSSSSDSILIDASTQVNLTERISPLVTDISSSDVTVAVLNSDDSLTVTSEGNCRITGTFLGKKLYLRQIEASYEHIYISVDVGDKYNLAEFDKLSTAECASAQVSPDGIISLSLDGTITALSTGQAVVSSGVKRIHVYVYEAPKIYIAVGETADLSGMFSEFNYNGHTWNTLILRNNFGITSSVSADGTKITGICEGKGTIIPIYEESVEAKIYDEATGEEIGYSITTTRYLSTGEIYTTSKETVYYDDKIHTGENSAMSGNSDWHPAYTEYLYADVYCYDTESCDEAITLTVGQSLELIGYELPADAYRLTVEASAPSVVVADRSGSITGRKVGTSTLVAVYTEPVVTYPMIGTIVPVYASDEYGRVYDDGSIIGLTQNTRYDTDAEKSIKENNVIKTIAVTVTSGSSADNDRPVSSSGLMLSHSKLSLNVDESACITAWLIPSSTTEELNVQWRSSAPSVASVDSYGNVSGISAGTATITAIHGAYSKACTVTVNPISTENSETTVTISATDLIISRTALTLTSGETSALFAWLTPSNTTEKADISWSSSNKAIVTVDSYGNVTAVAPGTATVTASQGKFSETCTVTVSGAASQSTAPVSATDIMLSRSSLTLVKGSSSPLSAWLTPNNTTDALNAVWSSSDSSVATVDSSGNVKAVSVGTATITVRHGDFTDTCTVSVVAGASDHSGSGSSSGNTSGSYTDNGKGTPDTGDSDSNLWAPVILSLSVMIMIITLPFMIKPHKQRNIKNHR